MHAGLRLALVFCLSLRERGPIARRFRFVPVFSLSLWERAGVRATACDDHT